MADDDDRFAYDEQMFDETYDDSNYVKLALVFDGSSVTLKVRTKKVPGVGESGQILAKRSANGRYTFDFGLGDEDYEPGDVPDPIRKLVDSQGGGPAGHSVAFPPRAEVITSGYLIRPYGEYASRWRQRWLSGKERMEKPLSKAMYMNVGRMYLEALGVPLYL